MIKENEQLGVDYILCTKDFYECFKSIFPELTREENGECYMKTYRCEFVDEDLKHKNPEYISEDERLQAFLYGEVRNHHIGHVNKPSRQEFMDAKYKRKNFAKDYLMKGKRW